MFQEQIASRSDNPFLMLRAKLHDRLGPQGRETVRAKATQAVFDAELRTEVDPWVEFAHEGYKFRVRNAGDDLEVELIGEPTLNEALAARGLSHKRDALTGADGRHTIKDASGTVVGRYTATEAWAEVINDTKRPLPDFDPSKVRIERHRMSVTQGEASVFYDERLLNRYGDQIKLLEKEATAPAGAQVIGGYHGYGDQEWIDAARRVITRGSW
ncbi:MULTISPECIES: hypothetical protein [Microvirga]|uniref:hypothetical protein n=1 Tax=Microvirga TaxID=186650 RepID=UPI0021CA0BD1|nr:MULTISPECIES: hypothetical protein [unclassified Microvirga]